MRRLQCALLAATAAIGFASVVSAADMPTKAPAYQAPAAVGAYNWTGFYVGGNVGWSGGRFHDDAVYTNPNYTSPIVATLASVTNSANGFVGGGQVGYNWQANNWLYGLEADFQGTGQKATLNCSQPIVFGPVSSDGPINCSAQQRLDWFGTVRGRIGTIAADRFLVYATGGLAYGHVNTNFAIAIPDASYPSGYYVSPTSASAGSVRAGWTAGAGVEMALVGNWTVKAEYLYLDLGSINQQFVFTNNNTTFNKPMSVNITKSVQDHIIRLGVNYSFGH
jgi:outer membrane immunogenic protein